MQCTQCGATSDEGQRFCYNCGARLEAQYAPPAPPTQTMPAPPPYQPQPYQPQPIQHGSYQQQPAMGYSATVVPNSNTAIISLVSGILAWIMLPVIAALVAIVTGHMARNEIRQAGGRLAGDGLAVIGMVLGYAQIAIIAIGVCLLLFFIVAVA